MPALRVQFLLAYAVMGSLLPYLPVYLSRQGLTSAQIGYVLSTAGLAVLLTPVLTALAADTRVQNRTLLGLLYAASAAALLGLLTADGFWAILFTHSLFALAFAPFVPLSDALFFAEQRRRRDLGQPVVAYHRVRVYGTVGFIVPSLFLYLLLRQDVPIGVTLGSAIVCALLGLANTARLPRVRIGGHPSEPVDDAADAGASSDRTQPAAAGRASPSGPVAVTRARPELPTLAAARALLEPHLAVFCLAMWLVHVATAGYYVFYPIYLTDTIGFDQRWIGLISSIGVTIEIFFVLAFGRLLARFGLRGLMTLGALAIVARMALLWLVPTPTVAIATQALHGLMVLVIHVAPPIFLNHHAKPHYRNSMQGLFAMLIYGTGRITGSVVSGWIADANLLAVFAAAAALALLTTTLFAFAFSERHHEAVQP